MKPAGRLTLFIEMQAIAWGAPGQAGGKGGWATLKIGPRTTNAVGIDHHTGIAIGKVITTHRRHNRLIINAGVGHHDADGLAGGDKAAFKCRHFLGLAKRLIMREINAARVSDHRDNNFAAVAGKVFDKADAGVTNRFRICHHMRLTDWHHINSVKKPANLHLMINGPFLGQAARAGQYGVFFVIQFHVKTPTFP